jgi:hypothetical protein
VREVGAPEPVAPPERVAKAETFDYRSGNGEADQTEPGNRGQDRGDREERHEEVDGDADGERAKQRAPVGPHSRSYQAGADV